MMHIFIEVLLQCMRSPQASIEFVYIIKICFKKGLNDYCTSSNDCIYVKREDRSRGWDRVSHEFGIIIDNVLNTFMSGSHYKVHAPFELPPATNNGAIRFRQVNGAKAPVDFVVNTPPRGCVVDDDDDDDNSRTG